MLKVFKKYQFFLFFFVFLFFVLAANSALAVRERWQPLEIQYPPLPFSGVERPNDFIQKIHDEAPGYTPDKALSLYTIYFYHLFLSISGLIALGAITVGGVRYLISVGSPTQAVAAKEQISGGILGLIVLFSSYLILSVISPQLTFLGISRTEAPVPTFHKECVGSACMLVEGTGPDQCNADKECFSPEYPVYIEIPTGRLIELVIKRGKEAEVIAKQAKTEAERLASLAEDLKRLTDQCQCGNSEPDCLGCPSIDNACSLNDPCPCTECVGGPTSSPITAPEAPVGLEVDLLGYFLPPGSPEVHISSGETFQSIPTGGNTFKIQKSPTTYEAFRHDSNYIYHLEDTSWATGLGPVRCEGTSDNAYFSLLDGNFGVKGESCNAWNAHWDKEGMKWAPRTMEVGDVFSSEGTVIGFSKATGDCCETPYSGPGGGHTVSLDYQGCITFPTGVTRTDAVIFRVIGGAGVGETFYYDKSLGWIGWNRGDPNNGNYLTGPTEIAEGDCLRIGTGTGIRYTYSPCDPCPNREQMHAKQQEMLISSARLKLLNYQLKIAMSKLAIAERKLSLAEALMRDALFAPISYDGLAAIKGEKTIRKIKPWEEINIREDLIPGEISHKGTEDIEDPATFYVQERGNEDLIAKLETVTFEALNPTPVSPCPSGQEKPHRVCNGANCIEINSCGVNACDADSTCLIPPSTCPAGTSIPYNVCDGPTCRIINSCGVSTCSDDEQCSPSHIIMLDVPAFRQRDGRWASQIIDECIAGNSCSHASSWDANSMLCSGCGPTSLAMILKYFSINVTPAIIAQQTRRGIEFACDTGSYSHGLAEMARSRYGLPYQSISFSDIQTHLEAGHPIMASCRAYGPGAWSHITIIKGIGPNHIFFQDSEQGSISYSIDEVRTRFQCSPFYAFSQP